MPSEVSWLEVSVFDVSANELLTEIGGGCESGCWGESSCAALGNWVGSVVTLSSVPVPREEFTERGGEQFETGSNITPTCDWLDADGVISSARVSSREQAGMVTLSGLRLEERGGSGGGVGTPL